MIQPYWLETDEAHDVTGSVRHAVRCFEFVRSDPQAWKWLFLALYSAIQGACVCYLSTTAAPIGAVDEKNAAEWLNFFETIQGDAVVKPPKTRLMALPDLLKAVSKSNAAGGPGVGRVLVSDSDIKWLTRLHTDVRNQFVHFAPAGWVLEVSGIPEMAKLVGRIILDIADHGWAFRHLSEGDINAMREDLHILKSESW